MSATLLESRGPVAVSDQVVLRTSAYLRSSGLLPVMCSLIGDPIKSCHVTVTTVVDGQTVTVGRGHAGVEGRPAAHKIAVGVELSDLGRALAGRSGGARVLVDAVVQGAASTSYVVSEPHVIALRP